MKLLLFLIVLSFSPLSFAQTKTCVDLRSSEIFRKIDETTYLAVFVIHDIRGRMYTRQEFAVKTNNNFQQGDAVSFFGDLSGKQKFMEDGFENSVDLFVENIKCTKNYEDKQAKLHYLDKKSQDIYNIINNEIENEASIKKLDKLISIFPDSDKLYFFKTAYDASINGINGKLKFAKCIYNKIKKKDEFKAILPSKGISLISEVQYKNLNKIKFLVEDLGMPINEFFEEYSVKKNPLSIAIINQDLDTIKSVLALKADTNLKTNDYDTYKENNTVYLKPTEILLLKLKAIEDFCINSTGKSPCEQKTEDINHINEIMALLKQYGAYK